MKKNLIYLSALFALSTLTTRAQDPVIPQPSTKQIITQEFGVGKITLTYSRPNVKGRKVFGQMEPYGLVWRTGANYATTLQFTDEDIIEGQKVPAGEYGLFSIPGEKEWTFILGGAPGRGGAGGGGGGGGRGRGGGPGGGAPRGGGARAGGGGGAT